MTATRHAPSSRRRSLLNPEELRKALVLLPLLCVLLAGCGGKVHDNPHDPQPLLSANPSHLDFGNVAVGSTASLNITLTNSGSANNLIISQASVSGSGFILTGLSTPLTLAPGQSSSCTIRFSPPTAGTSTGAISFTTNATSSVVSLPVSGSGIQAQLSISSTSVTFGSVFVGSSSLQTVTLTNSGSADLTISQVNVTGAGFHTSGFTTPVTLHVGQVTAVTIVFAPTAPGAASGTISVVSNAVNSPATIAVSGTGAQSQLIVLTPMPVDFGNVSVGSSSARTITLRNSGNTTVTITQGSVSGSGFTMTGLTIPLTLAAGQNTSFTAQFAPQAAGSVTGSITITSNAINPTVTISLSGTGTDVQSQLIVLTPTPVDFGNVSVGSSSARTITLQDLGNTTVTITQGSVSGSGFTMTGLTIPLTLAAGQNTSFTAQFAPQAAGSVTGSITITSNAINPTVTIPLSGTGTTPTTHSVDLSWVASTSVVVGYNVYRGSQTGGPYTRINATLTAGTTYTDTQVQSGLTYFYVVTAVDSSNTESVNSNEASATIP